MRLVDDFARHDLVSRLGTHWQGVSDQVMGGVSRETVTLDTVGGRRCLRLTGDVRLDNDGGFIQMAVDLAAAGAMFDASAYDGIEIDVRGNGEPYDLRLRTADCVRPWQSYRTSFPTSGEWTTLRIAFFELNPHRLATPLDIRKLRRLGLVAVGREFHADLAVARLAFYHARH
jgi:hypothetical protein